MLASPQTSRSRAGDFPSAPSWFCRSVVPAICWNFGSILNLTLRQGKRSLISKRSGRRVSVSKVYMQLSCLTFMSVCQGRTVGNRTDLARTPDSIPQGGHRWIVAAEVKCFSWQPLLGVELLKLLKLLTHICKLSHIYHVMVGGWTTSTPINKHGAGLLGWEVPESKYAGGSDGSDVHRRLWEVVLFISLTWLNE